MAALPTVLALISIAPVLVAALIDPFQQLGAIWDGPVDALANPVLSGPVDGTSVLAAVLLTVAAALAAIGFGGRPAETVPVILPGLAVTLLIAPVALHMAWPAATGRRAGRLHHLDAGAGADPAAGRHPGTAAAGHPLHRLRHRPGGRRCRAGRQPGRPGS